MSSSSCTDTYLDMSASSSSSSCTDTDNEYIDMSSSPCADSLVFKLEEVDIDTNKKDTTVYVLYDNKTNNYIIRGNRKNNMNTYSFNCELEEDLADFIQYIICRTNRVNETLLIYKNLPSPIYLTFDYLEDEYDAPKEISGYDDKKLVRNRLLRMLRMIRIISSELKNNDV